MKDLKGDNGWSKELYLDITCSECGDIAHLSAKTKAEQDELRAFYNNQKSFFCEKCEIEYHYTCIECGEAFSLHHELEVKSSVLCTKCSQPIIPGAEAISFSGPSNVIGQTPTLDLEQALDEAVKLGEQQAYERCLGWLKMKRNCLVALANLEQINLEERNEYFDNAASIDFVVGLIERMLSKK